MIVTPLFIILLIILLIVMGYVLVVSLLKYVELIEIDAELVGILMMILLIIVIYIMVGVPLIGALVARLMR